MKKILKFGGFLFSFAIVAWGQPARAGSLGALAAACGFALFFACLPVSLTKPRKFLWGSLWFAAVQMVQLSWMTSIEFQGYYILFVYLVLAAAIGCQFGLLALAIPAEGKIPLSQLTYCASLWTLMEWVRLFAVCGFTWNPIGLALTHFPLSLQFVSVFGVFGLSFWVMLTNLTALNIWRTKGSKASALSWLILIAIPYLFGAAHFAYHLPKSKRADQAINVALVQTDLLPSEKSPHAGRVTDFVSPFVQWQRIIRELKEHRAPHWEMIVLPEAAVAFQSDMTIFPLDAVRSMLMEEFGPDIEKDFPALSYPFAEEHMLAGSPVMCVSNLFWCQTLATHFKAEFVAGFDHTDKSSQKNFNSAFHLEPEAKSWDRYDKQVLLPLAEYLPFECLRSLTKNYGIFNFFTQGRESIVWGDKIPFSPSICYEETFPEVMREGKLKGAQLFVNITNDNYYPHSTLHEQHLFHARVRAAENGIPLVRSCNSGVSAAIDGFGRIVARLEASKQNSAQGASVLTCHLNTYSFPTLYTFWGDGFLVTCCLLCCFSVWWVTITHKVKNFICGNVKFPSKCSFTTSASDQKSE